MKKIRLILLVVVVIILCTFITPSSLSAAPIEFSRNGHYYEFVEEQLSWSGARDSAISMGGYLATITTPEETVFIGSNFGVRRYWIGGYQLEGSTEPGNGWQWVTGEAWGSYTNWHTLEPNNSTYDEDFLEVFPFEGVYWNDYSDRMVNYYLIEYDTDPSIVEEETVSTVVEEEPISARYCEMTCYQVWINEDNKFEFVFWWEYKNNNWVKIYDMAGVEVFSIDMTYGKADFEADLPDGIYTVKTFHNGFENPIQEFVIGKP